MKATVSTGLQAIFYGMTMIFSTISLSAAQATSPYVHAGAIGVRPAPANSVGQTETRLRLRPIAEWVGEKFVFLPQSKEFQDKAYAVFREDGAQIDGAKYAGRVAKVISLGKKDELPEVVFAMEDNQEILKSSLEYGCIINMAPVADIDSARTWWLNQTLWLKRESMYIIDETNTVLDSVKVDKNSPVKVVEVVCGMTNSAPVRFVLQTPGGKVGFIDCNFSGTNAFDKMIKDRNHFEEYFLTEDPKLERK